MGELEKAEKHLADADEFINQFKDHVDSVRETLNDKKEDLMSTAQDFTSNLTDKLNGWVGNVEDLMSNGESMVSDLQDNLGNLAETVLDALKEKFMEAVVNALGENFEPLSGAFEAFEALSGVCGGDPGGRDWRHHRLGGPGHRPHRDGEAGRRDRPAVPVIVTEERKGAQTWRHKGTRHSATSSHSSPR